MLETFLRGNSDAIVEIFALLGRRLLHVYLNYHLFDTKLYVLQNADLPLIPI